MATQQSGLQTGDCKVSKASNKDGKDRDPGAGWSLKRYRTWHKSNGPLHDVLGKEYCVRQGGAEGQSSSWATWRELATCRIWLTIGPWTDAPGVRDRWPAVGLLLASQHRRESLREVSSSAASRQLRHMYRGTAIREYEKREMRGVGAAKTITARLASRAGDAQAAAEMGVRELLAG